MDMTDHSSQFSSKSSPSLPKIPQYLNVTPEGKAGTVPGSTIATAVTLSLRQLQVTVLECETYKVCKSKKQKVHS